MAAKAEGSKILFSGIGSIFIDMMHLHDRLFISDATGLTTAFGALVDGPSAGTVSLQHVMTLLLRTTHTAIRNASTFLTTGPAPFNVCGTMCIAKNTRNWAQALVTLLA